jgi:hypothetical protein
MIPKSEINIVTAELGTESGLYGAIELARRAERSAVAINSR